ncbi:hypothetical protein pb186bvf_018650 [Paramecium bursaria]
MNNFFQLGRVYYFFDFLIIIDTKVLTINIAPNVLRKFISQPRRMSNKQLNRTQVWPVMDTSDKLPFIYALFINNQEKYDVSPINIKNSISIQLGIMSCFGDINKVAAGTIKDINEKYCRITI